MAAAHDPTHSQDEHTASSLVCHLGFAVAMTAASVAGGTLMVGNSFSLPSIHPDYAGVISWANFAGVLLLIFGVPIGLVRVAARTWPPWSRLGPPAPPLQNRTAAARGHNLLALRAGGGCARPRGSGGGHSAPWASVTLQLDPVPPLTSSARCCRPC